MIQEVPLCIHTQLDHISDDAHDQEAHAHGLGDAEEFAAVGCLSLAMPLPTHFAARRS